MEFPLIVATSGASGTVYAFRLLEFLLENNYRVEFVISMSALMVARDEIGLQLSSNPDILKQQVLSYLKLNSSEVSLNVNDFNDISAPVSSGSFRTSGMVIIPASMDTIAKIRSGITDNLITRAADVCLKEKRKLVLVPREMPLNSIHLENMLGLSKLGAFIAPACPGFYHNPKHMSDLVDFVIGKVLDLLGIENSLFNRWKEKKVTTQVFLYDKNKTTN